MKGYICLVCFKESCDFGENVCLECINKKGTYTIKAYCDRCLADLSDDEYRLLDEVVLLSISYVGTNVYALTLQCPFCNFVQVKHGMINGSDFPDTGRLRCPRCNVIGKIYEPAFWGCVYRKNGKYFVKNLQSTCFECNSYFCSDVEWIK